MTVLCLFFSSVSEVSVGIYLAVMHPCACVSLSGHLLREGEEAGVLTVASSLNKEGEASCSL